MVMLWNETTTTRLMTGYQVDRPPDREPLRRLKPADQLQVTILETRYSEPENVCLTDACLDAGGWPAFWWKLLRSELWASVIIAVMLYIPFRAAGNNYDVAGLEQELYTALVMLGASALGYIKAGQSLLRVRGWLITSIPMVAALYALYNVLF